MERYKITKPIRLIELFSGYSSQSLALKYIGANFENYRTCEWAVKSIQACKDLHFGNDNVDYSKDLSKEELIEYLFKKGISADYNKPMNYNQIKRLGEQKLRNIYNNIKATHNMVNIQQVKGEDLGITDIDKYEYLMTYSYPCTDLSTAGKMAGMEKGSGTRSSLLWEVERILTECSRGGYLPQVLIMENVPQVHGKKNKASFDKWCEFLTSIGYKNYWQDLNSKNYGIPQNRKRCFMVSILGDYSYEFPQPIPLELKLKDLLEDEVDEKYYLSDKNKTYVLDENDIAKNSGRNINDRIVNPNIAKTISCRGAVDQRADVTNFVIDNVEQELTVKEVKNITNLQKEVCNKALDFMTPTDTIDYTYSNERLSEMQNGFVKTRNKENNQIMNTLTTNCENFGVCVEEKQNLKQQLCNKLIEEGKVKENDIIRHSYTNNRLNNGDKNMGRIENHEGLSPTLDTRCDCLGICKNLRIRKLTPTECLRLMGVKDEDIMNMSKNQSNASLYHLAGDSIVTTCLCAIFGELLGVNWQENLISQEWWQNKNLRK